MGDNIRKWDPRSAGNPATPQVVTGAATVTVDPVNPLKVSLVLTLSHQVPLMNAQYAWGDTMNSSIPITQSVVTHTYAAPGTYTINVSQASLPATVGYTFTPFALPPVTVVGP